MSLLYVLIKNTISIFARFAFTTKISKYIIVTLCTSAKTTTSLPMTKTLCTVFFFDFDILMYFRHALVTVIVVFASQSHILFKIQLNILARARTTITNINLLPRDCWAGVILLVVGTWIMMTMLMMFVEHCTCTHTYIQETI